MLVAAMNPCPCGHFGDPQKACTCSPLLRQRYRERISGLLLDRIDLRFTVPRLVPDEVLRARPGEPSKAVAARVASARARALSRQGLPNAQLAGSALRRHAALAAGSEVFMRSVTERLALSGRGYDRLLRLARTIADFADSNAVGDAHLAEAVRYREGG